jgi:hypothetical protein
MQSITRGKFTVDLSGNWQTYAQPVAGFRMLGVFLPRHGIPQALAVSDSGEYVAINGRYVTPLASHKVEAALLAELSRTAIDTGPTGGFPEN